MSFVVIQLGQCGNQLGLSFFNLIFNSIKDLAKEKPKLAKVIKTTYFHSTPSRTASLSNKEASESHFKLTARAILVDTESKVIKQILRSQETKAKKGWQFCKENMAFHNGGASNNWANGYCIQGPRLFEAIKGRIHQEVLKCNHFAGFVLMQSLAGGTGSGLGSYFTEQLRSEYPTSFVYNFAVGPYAGGEVAMQAYNVTLTLTHLYKSSDLIFLIQNDDLHKLTQERQKSKQVSLLCLNTLAVHTIANILLSKINDLCQQSKVSLLHHLSCHPHFKLISILGLPKDSCQYTWKSLLKQIKSSRKGFACLAFGLVTLGKEKIILSEVSNAQLEICSPNVLESTFLKQSNLLPLYYEKEIYFLSNSNSVLPFLEKTLTTALEMYKHKAYLHHYQKPGICKNHFEQAFEVLNQSMTNDLLFFDQYFNYGFNIINEKVIYWYSSLSR